MKPYNRTENRTIIIAEMNDLAYKTKRRPMFVSFGEHFSAYNRETFSKLWSDEDLVMIEFCINKKPAGRWRANRFKCLRVAHTIRYEPDMTKAWCYCRSNWW